MTDYDTMAAGAEMDAAVAEKVMGWKVHPRNTAHWMRATDDHIEYRPTSSTCSPDRWSPSTRIDHAWEVANRFIAACEEFKLVAYQITNGMAYDAKFGTFWSGQCDTAPLAICRAALKAVTK